MTRTQKGLIAVGTLGVGGAALLGWLPEQYTWDEIDGDDDEARAEAAEEDNADALEPLKHQRDPGAPPNVVVFVVDGLGPESFGFNGNETAQTPRIDALAAESAVFTDAYSVAPASSPARAGLLSGRYPQRFGHEHPLPRDSDLTTGLPLQAKTLGDHLHDHGYVTGAFGKWHLGRHPRFHPNRRGFDTFFGFLAGQRSHFPDEVRRDEWLQRDGKATPEDFDYLSDALAENAARFVDAHAFDPFLLYVGWPLVHEPFQALQSDLDAQARGLQGRERREAAMLAALDRGVGQVLDAIETNHLTDDTLVFLTSDTGGDDTLRESGVKVPLLLRWPDAFEPGPRAGLVSTMDIVPTAMSAGNLPIPTTDGADLLPWLTGEQDSSPHTLLFWRIGPRWAVRASQSKLVHEGRSVLYDIGKDPEENTNLAPRRPEVVDTLTKRYEAWSQQLAEPAWRPPGQ